MKNKLILILIFLALAGLMLHFRIHPFIVQDKINPENYVFDSTKFLATLLPLIDLFIVTLLFTSERTAVYGYLLNGMLVIYGTIFMVHYSIAEMIAKSIPLAKMVLRSTLPDIAIAWADFFVGKILYEAYLREKHKKA